ncbi:MAG: class I SAM-dependent methyltransferase [Flavobacteriaceae bacterium]
MKVKDFSVSKEAFELQYDTEYDLFKTFPLPENLDKYYQSDDYISHTDGKRSLFEKLYHWVKQYTLSQKENLISTYVKKKGNLLDIGTGTGDFLVYAKTKSWRAVGVEPNAKAKELARKKGVSLVENTQELSNGAFDIITMWHVLEHIQDLNQQIAELKRICKPGGYIIIAVPNFKSFDANYYKEFWAAYDVPRHLWHFSKTAITKLFSESEIKLEKIHPMYFDSFYVSLLSEKYKTGKMNYLRAFFVGLLSNLKGIFSKEFSSHIYVLKNSKN